MLLVGITLFSILMSFIAGFVLQNYCIWVDGNNNKEHPKASILIPWLFRNRYWIFKIKCLSFLRNKERLYAEAMKRELVHGRLEMVLFQGLMQEKNTKNIRPILDAVFQVMEKNRRKSLPTNDRKFKKHFFVRNMFIERGFGFGMRLSEYCELFVLYNRYLKGEYLAPEFAIKGAQLFGTLKEKVAAEYDKKILINELQIRKEIKETQAQNEHEKKKEKLNRKERVKEA